VKVEAECVLTFSLAAPDKPISSIFQFSIQEGCDALADCDKNAPNLKNRRLLVEIFSEKASRGTI
jgi:hypothetical protein